MLSTIVNTVRFDAKYLQTYAVCVSRLCLTLPKEGEKDFQWER